jgi:hypothetical protein
LTLLDSLITGDHFRHHHAAPEPLVPVVFGEGVENQISGGGPGLLECAYRNASDRMVIVRCLGPSSFFLERVVFPFELLSFACPPESEVEILTHGLGGPELLESMPARVLLLDLPLAPVEPPQDGLADPHPWLQAG